MEKKETNMVGLTPEEAYAITWILVEKVERDEADLKQREKDWEDEPCMIEAMRVRVERSKMALDAFKEKIMGM